MIRFPSSKGSSVDWSYRIRKLAEVYPGPNECPAYDINLSDSDTPVLKLWGM